MTSLQGLKNEQAGIPSHLLGYRFPAGSARQSPHLKQVPS